MPTDARPPCLTRLDQLRDGDYGAPMDVSVNMYEAKTHLSRLVDRVEAGEEIVIARAGRPVARLVPYRGRQAPRTPGLWKGQVRLAADFDAPDDTLHDLFER